jgi:hemerythrin-like metal-binding protein
MNNNVYIVWNDTYDLGIRIIDEQHRGIVSLINSFHFLSTNNFEKSVLLSVTESIFHYAIIHFSTEEKILRGTKYPDLQYHETLHDQLKKKSKFKASEVIKYDNPEIYLKFLKEWWLYHINVEDRKYIRHVIDFFKITH